jgi:deoxyribonuclease V
VLELHSWDVSPAEARGIQESLRHRVVREDHLGAVTKVAGVDVGFEDHGQVTRAAAVVLSFPELRLVDQVIAKRPTEFPYVPGLLSFREIPAVLEAFEKLRTMPDLVLCDGQGIAHPRRFGIACHLGVLMDLPTIGVAKTRLIGTHINLPVSRGSYVPLLDKGEQIGVVLRTRSGVRPVYVSVGHKISLATATRLVMACITRYRLPETTRWADRIASNRGAGTRPPRRQ